MNMENKVAWITGGISGIGGATSLAFHEQGAKLLLTDINEEAGIEYTKQFGDDALFVKADVTNREELKSAAKQAVDKWGHLDIMINCAGRGFGGVFLSDDEDVIEQSFKNWDAGIKVNLYGSYNTAQIAANYMKNNEPDENGEKGNIIFLASMAADKVWNWFDERVASTAFAYDYGASKAAILGLNRDLAVTLSHHGIRVNSIKPGYIKTPLTAATGVADEIWAPMQLFPKQGGKPENIASVAVEIVKNPFINRAEMQVDAGIVG
ncbi:SDR family NAD(P)-dependent oxidoreductase [Planococcus ruber]|uniref:SDR family NAD(P)-dependent oxidoreductase n=1 Tax=Planococcus ruber TaxID=2027871 RepID=UPI001FEE3DD4|nr:SDR family NAD(P)-dependent oxidoreductase [Planococcus ruber]MCJ1910028.1 SDR family oxidoreductase [Planococcus ruber]